MECHRTRRQAISRKRLGFRNSEHLGDAMKRGDWNIASAGTARIYRNQN